MLPLGGLFFFLSGPELIPLFPYLRAGLLKRGDNTDTLLATLPPVTNL